MRHIVVYFYSKVALWRKYEDYLYIIKRIILYLVQNSLSNSILGVH